MRIWTRMKTPLIPLVLSTVLILAGEAFAQDNPQVGQGQSDAVSTQAAQRDTTDAANAQNHFEALLTNATLQGRWASLQDGELGEEKTGDKYHIVSVKKGSGDNWIVNAKLGYRGEEMVLPIPVRVKFAADTAILLVDKMAVPGGGTYSARVMFHGQTYTGTWSGERGGGMLYGTITRAEGSKSAGDE